MRFRLIQLLLTAVAIPAVLHAQSVPSRTGQDAARFLGVWRGQFDNLPGVDMVVTDEGGDLRGAILFYLHKRKDVNSPYISTPGIPEPVLNLKVMDGVLSFEVSHRRAHPPGSLNDPPMKFHVKIQAPDQAELTNESEGAPGLEMKRSDY